MPPPPPMSPEEVNAYLEQHGLETILADAVNEAVTARAEDPVAFIADLLSKRSAPPLRTISCWLVPPEPDRTKLLASIAATAKQNGLPAFAPHITLIGNVDLPKEEAVKRLQQLAGTGAVPCRFTSVEAFPPWHQSAVAVVEHSSELVRAQLLARKAFFGVDEPEESWAPPVEKAHLSLAYGSKPEVATSLALPASFVATEMWLFDLNPVSAGTPVAEVLAGVPNWHEVARVSLVPP